MLVNHAEHQQSPYTLRYRGLGSYREVIHEGDSYNSLCQEDTTSVVPDPVIELVKQGKCFP